MDQGVSDNKRLRLNRYLIAATWGELSAAHLATVPGGFVRPDAPYEESRLCAIDSRTMTPNPYSCSTRRNGV